MYTLNMGNIPYSDFEDTSISDLFSRIYLKNEREGGLCHFGQKGRNKVASK